MPTRVTPIHLPEDDGGRRYARTLEEAFGSGHRSAIIYEPSASKMNYGKLSRALMRVVYTVTVLMLLGLAYGNIHA